MIYKKIPNTDIETALLCMGSNSIGTNIDEKTSFALFDTYLDCGGNHIDTAHLYGDGKSEETIGKWLKQSGKRNDIVLTTKGGFPYGREPRLSKAEVSADLNQSLSRLGCDYVDLFLLHRDSDTVPVEEIIDYLNEFVKSGKIRHFGCSNWGAERIAKANAYAKASSQMGFCVSQIKWSLGVNSPAYREDPTLSGMNDNEYKFYLTAGMAVMSYSSQAKGFFTKMAQGGEAALSEKSHGRYLCDENIKRLERALELAKEKNVSVSAIVLAYLYSRPFTSAAVLGCSNPSQLTDSLSASDLILTEDEINFLIK